MRPYNRFVSRVHPAIDHPIKSEKYRDDSHGLWTRMTRTNREGKEERTNELRPEASRPDWRAEEPHRPHEGPKSQTAHEHGPVSIFAFI